MFIKKKIRLDIGTEPEKPNDSYFSNDVPQKDQIQ